MPSRLIQRHDQFFKRLLEHEGTAGALLRERLPPAVADRLGPDAPELVSGSFVNRELQEHQTDRLYRVRMVDGETAFIYALIEHKSSPDPHMALQLLSYMVQIWQWWIRHESLVTAEDQVNEWPGTFLVLDAAGFRGTQGRTDAGMAALRCFGSDQSMVLVSEIHTIYPLTYAPPLP